VAGFGTVAAELERSAYADSRARGAAYAGVLVGATSALGIAAERLAARHRGGRVAVTALATWTVLGGRSLEREAVAVDGLLRAGDLAGARRSLRHLVGRDPTGLDASGISRAVVESVAENTADAVVAPLLWGALAGVPGLLAYRAANTLDAMVGHRGERYQRFGWAAARLDDLANLPASRLAGLLTAAAAPRRAGAVVRTWRRDAASHPSPNAGVVEAAFAGALAVRLGGTNTYGTGPDARVEHRPLLGDGPAPTPDDIPRAVILARRVGLGAALTTTLLTLLMDADPSLPHG
jgi:adenosylcobinamide-phosphate synthase